MTGPPKLDSRITIGVSTNRGPISTRETLVSPRSSGGGFLGALAGLESVEVRVSCPLVVEWSDFEMAVSLIWKHRIQILPSAMVKPMT